MKFKLDNEEILECDCVYCITTSCIPKYILKAYPTRLSREYIKGCTLALNIGYTYIRTISYVIGDKMYYKHIPICNLSHSITTESWIRTHLLYDEI